MADTRINALSTATSSVSDDYVPIDGTTNGTRKLSAYSPTFGGNATVGGTLTVNGTSTSSVAGSLGIGTTTPTSYAARVLQINDSSGSTSAGIKLTNNTTGVTNDDGLDITMSGSTGYIIQRENASLIFQTNATTALTLNSSQGATIAGTTASTSTSSGALVVGNGTSGGLGVGGSVVLGANLVSTASDGKIQITGTGNTTGNKEISLQRSDAADSFAIGLTGSAYAGALTGLGNNEAFIYNSSASAFRIFLGTASTNRFDFTSSQFKINPTTASTSTSSGALVVSGGVGVAGAIVTGGIVRCGGSNGLSLGSDTGNIRIDTAGPAGVEFRGLSSADTITGFTMREMALIDGTTAPSTRAGYATIYVDTADGDLKVKFGDGTVKTIATDS